MHHDPDTVMLAMSMGDRIWWLIAAFAGFLPLAVLALFALTGIAQHLMGGKHGR